MDFLFQDHARQTDLVRKHSTLYVVKLKKVIVSQSNNNPISYTAMKFWLRTIADIWSKVGVLWGCLMHPKHPAKPYSCKLPKGGDESFQMRYYMTL